MAKIRVAQPFDVATWIDHCVLGDLRTLCVGIDTYLAAPTHRSESGSPLGGANFLLVAGCCAAIEYCGHVYGAKGSHENQAIAFIRKFLVPINCRYGEVDELFWNCFRHGTIHSSWPKVIEIPGELPIATGAGNERSDPHLAAAMDVIGPSFMINGRQLLADLETSLAGEFGRWLSQNDTPQVRRRAAPEAFVASGPKLRAQAQTVRSWYVP